LLLRRGRQARPGAFAVDAIDEQCERTLAVASSDLLCRHWHPRSDRREAGCRAVGPKRWVEVAARFGQHQLSQQLRSRLRHAKPDMSAAGMAHQVYRPGIQFLKEADHVVDMLCHQVVVADAIPVLGKESPQARRDHAMPFCQWPQHRIPGAEIAERAVYEDQRRAVVGAAADIEIGHVIAVDAQCLHRDQVSAR
jgi:hypothetical protein